MKLTENFTLEEMTASRTADKYNIDNTPTAAEVENLKRLCLHILQPIRDEINRPLTVTSGYRCRELNKKVGGVPTSQHVTGDAADITLKSKQANNKLFNVIADMIRQGKITVGQLINEKGGEWLHISNPRQGKKTNEIIYIN